VISSWHSGCSEFYHRDAVLGVYENKHKKLFDTKWQTVLEYVSPELVSVVPPIKKKEKFEGNSRGRGATLGADPHFAALILPSNKIINYAIRDWEN
jgi:hypothetical protein